MHTWLKSALCRSDDTRAKEDTPDLGQVEFTNPLWEGRAGRPPDGDTYATLPVGGPPNVETLRAGVLALPGYEEPGYLDVHPRGQTTPPRYQEPDFPVALPGADNDPTYQEPLDFAGPDPAVGDRVQDVSGELARVLGSLQGGNARFGLGEQVTTLMNAFVELGEVAALCQTHWVGDRNFAQARLAAAIGMMLNVDQTLEPEYRLAATAVALRGEDLGDVARRAVSDGQLSEYFAYVLERVEQGTPEAVFALGHEEGMLLHDGARDDALTLVSCIEGFLAHASLLTDANVNEMHGLRAKVQSFLEA